MMLRIHRRWHSIDRKLPLLASGLVILTALTLGYTAHVLLQHALLEAAGNRLATTANMVAQLVNRPRTRVTDSAALAADRALRAFLRAGERAGSGARSAALAALAHTSTPRDTAKSYAALVDGSGRTLLAYVRRPGFEPEWPAAAIARGAAGDTMSLGPIEDLRGVPTYTYIFPFRDTTAAIAAIAATAHAPRVIGYLVEGRAMYGGRSFRQIRGMIGNGASLAIGQPGTGVWTDMERVRPAPPIQPRSDTVADFDHDASGAEVHGVGAAARVVGTNWMVWISQPASVVLAPARTLLWSLAPLGL